MAHAVKLLDTVIDANRTDIPLDETALAVPLDQAALASLLVSDRDDLEEDVLRLRNVVLTGVKGELLISSGTARLLGS